MNVWHLLLLPLFGALLIASSWLNSVLLSAVFANVFAYIWIFVIWQDDKKQVGVCYAVFVLAIGPITYFGFDDVREGLVGLGYSWRKVYFFQPLAGLLLPAISLVVRLRRQDSPIDKWNYCCRSFLELVFGLPFLWFALSLIP